jgi:hypothetical protein
MTTEPELVFECQDLTYYYDVIREGNLFTASQWFKPKRESRLQAVAYEDIGERDECGDFVNFEVPCAEQLAVHWCIDRRMANRIPHLEAEARERNKG